MNHLKLFLRKKLKATNVDDAIKAREIEICIVDNKMEIVVDGTTTLDDLMNKYSTSASKSMILYYRFLKKGST